MHHLRGVAVHLDRLRQCRSRLPDGREDRLAGQRHLLPYGRRRHLHAVRHPDDVPDAVLDPGQLGFDRQARQGIHDRVPGAGNADDRRVLRARHRAVLRVLRGRPDPDVPDHRRVGRQAARLCELQVLPLHAARLGADAARHHGDVLAGAHHRHHPASDLQLPGRHADMAVAGVLRLVRGEDADVAGPHLAARRACRGADRRLGHPGRDPVEDGRIRFPALLAADVPDRLRRLRAARSSRCRWWRSSTPRWSR